MNLPKRKEKLTLGLLVVLNVRIDRTSDWDCKPPGSRYPVSGYMVLRFIHVNP